MLKRAFAPDRAFGKILRLWRTRLARRMKTPCLSRPPKPQNLPEGRSCGATSRASTFPAASGCRTPAAGKLAEATRRLFPAGARAGPPAATDPRCSDHVGEDLLDVLERGEARRSLTATPTSPGFRET